MRSVIEDDAFLVVVDVVAAAADGVADAAPTTADPTTNPNKLDKRNVHTAMIPDCIINCGIWDRIIHVEVVSAAELK